MCVFRCLVTAVRCHDTSPCASRVSRVLPRPEVPIGELIDSVALEATHIEEMFQATTYIAPDQEMYVATQFTSETQVEISVGTACARGTYDGVNVHTSITQPVTGNGTSLSVRVLPFAFLAISLRPCFKLCSRSALRCASICCMCICRP
jgi:hypothetical protein